MTRAIDALLSIMEDSKAWLGRRIEAADGLAAAVADAPIRDARVPVLSNVTAKPLVEAAAIRHELVVQVTSAVRWIASVQRMVEGGVDTFVEFGPGAVLTGLIKRIAPDVQILDITHGIPPRAVLQGALVLANTVPYMPIGVHLAVVDPGVGGIRRPLVLRDAEGRFFVGPDNARIFIDPKSFSLLDGTELDYDTSLMSRGFLFNNPNAKSTCGCGLSFNA